MSKQQALVLGIWIAMAGLSGVAECQEWTDWLGPSGRPNLRAGLREPAQNAKQHVAAIEVEVRNSWLNYPDVFEQPGVQIGVLQYQIDQCPPILTSDTRLRFQNLTARHHTIDIGLLDLKGDSLAPRAKLQVSIP